MSRRGGGRRQDTRSEPQQPSPSVYRGGRGDTRGGRGDTRGGRGDTRGGRGGRYRGGRGGPAFTPPISTPTSSSSSAAPTGVAAAAPTVAARTGVTAAAPIAAPRTGVVASAPTGVAAAIGTSSAGPISFGSHVASSSTEIVTKGVEKLSLGAPPSSSKAVLVPERPGYGTLGRKCVVRANHFLVRASVNEIFHYDVQISPEVTSKKVCREIITELVKAYQATHLENRMPAYDGMKSLYTAGALPFESKEFVVNLKNKDEDSSSSSARRERKFKVKIQFASKPDISHLQQFLQGRQRDMPQETIQALDVVLRASPSNLYNIVGRSFFSVSLGRKGDLEGGAEYWRGYYQSLRPIQAGLSLNIDVTAGSYYESILVSEFVVKYLNIRDLSKPLSDQDRLKVKKALKGIKVVLTYMNYARKCKITGVTITRLDQTKFSLDDNNRKVSVAEYFRDKYEIRLKYPALPALQAGSETRPVYFPMELCRIAEGQRYTRKLTPTQVKNMLMATCQRPNDRERSIKNIVDKNNYKGDKLVNEFNLHVETDLAKVDARVLPPPRLTYHASGKESNVNPSFGAWNMINKKMVNGGRVESWTCVNFSSRLHPDCPFEFCQDLINMCNSKGMEFNPNPVLPIRSARPVQIEATLHAIRNEATKLLQSQKKFLQLLIIILPDVRGSYGKIKRICETELGIVSQCCQPQQASRRSNNQYLENVALKINVKVGGRNNILTDAVANNLPLVSDRPTIIFGADVTHPQPGEDSSPSIAAVVASMDWPHVTKYRGVVSAQAHREEIIRDLYKCHEDPQKGVVHGGMIRESFIAFRRATGKKPDRVIFYRDGVSEGQFSQVLAYEVDAIRKACSTLEEGYQPRITFVVVQKRHRTRLFPAEGGQTDRSGNILPGTVVDTQICHPTEFDFYLNSHAGIKGTSKPSHYHVLYDENNFTADRMQKLTNDLCYTFARCTRSVSLVPPAYYAHLLAFRARYYIESETSDVESGSSRTVDIQVLPNVQENVKDVMFYC